MAKNYCHKITLSPNYISTKKGFPLDHCDFKSGRILYVHWELSSFSIKLTNESASFTQSANSGLKFRQFYAFLNHVINFFLWKMTFSKPLTPPKVCKISFFFEGFPTWKIGVKLKLSSDCEVFLASFPCTVA